MERIPVVVVGGGQAGLATSWWLTDLGIEHVVIDRGRVGDTWRRRWDSFCLVTPNWTLRLPGFPYEGPEPDGFLHRDAIVEYVERYAASFEPPLEGGVDVTGVQPSADGWKVSTSAGDWLAANVVIATGSFQHPRTPRQAGHLGLGVNQLHSSDYRRPEDLPDGAVLVVGSAQSGCQITDDLQQAGRQVWLSTSSAVRAPRRYRGRDVVEWLELAGMAAMTIDQHPRGTAARFESNPHVSGRDGGKEINLRAFGRDGVRLLGRVIDCSGTRISFSEDLTQNLDRADAAAREVEAQIDELIADRSLDAPADDRIPVAWESNETPTGIDLTAEDINSVIWATGFGFDFSWIGADVLGERGYPRQRRGVTEEPGLYFVGLNFMHTVGSSLFLGVGSDAEYVARHLAARPMG